MVNESSLTGNPSSLTERLAEIEKRNDAAGPFHVPTLVAHILSQDIPWLIAQVREANERADKAEAEQHELDKAWSDSVTVSELHLADVRAERVAALAQVEVLKKTVLGSESMLKLTKERDAWRKKWEALETSRASCCLAMERERDAAIAKVAALREALGMAREEIKASIEARFWSMGKEYLAKEHVHGSSALKAIDEALASTDR